MPNALPPQLRPQHALGELTPAAYLPPYFQPRHHGLSYYNYQYKNNYTLDILPSITLVLSLFHFFLGLIWRLALSMGNGWELVVIPLGNTIGVWGIGVVGAFWQKKFERQILLMRLVGTVVGSALGVGLILITPATGFGQVL